MSVDQTVVMNAHERGSRNKEIWSTLEEQTLSWEYEEHVLMKEYDHGQRDQIQRHGVIERRDYNHDGVW